MLMQSSIFPRGAGIDMAPTNHPGMHRHNT